MKLIIQPEAAAARAGCASSTLHLFGFNLTRLDIGKSSKAKQAA